MLTESNLIPFSVSEVPTGSFLIFSPHPDDEVFSMGGIISLAAEKGQSITIVYMTNGELGGDADVRVAEARAVCEKLGANASFLDIPDRNVKASNLLIDEIKKLIHELLPDSVFFPSPQEYHVDHRGTAASVWYGLQRANFKGDAYCYEVSRQCDCNVLIDISSYMDKKESLCQLYASQMTENNYLEVIKGINKSRTYTLPSNVAYAEGLLKIDDINVNSKNYFKKLHEDYFFNTLPSESPIISYLIRTKNRAECLKRCLNSLRDQPYKQNLDVVVVNDGGINVEEICIEFRIDFHRLKLINIPESIGRAGAANTALNNAIGEFVNFLDDDDEVEKFHTHVFLYHWRRDNEIEVLYRGVRVLDEKGELIRIYNEPYDVGHLMLNNFIPIHGVTFSRRFIDMGCRFDEKLHAFEDWDFWIQLSRLADFYHVPRVTATYHMVGSSAASPHMRELYDHQSGVNEVREKWLSKWSAVELSRMVKSIQRRSERRFQHEISGIRQTLENGVVSNKNHD